MSRFNLHYYGNVIRGKTHDAPFLTNYGIELEGVIGVIRFMHMRLAALSFVNSRC